MSTTVAVALITALSTVAGSTVSGGLALLISRGQRQAQLELFASSHVEERAREGRQVRRDAYVKFLNQVSLVERRLNSWWHSIPVDNLHEVEEFRQDVSSDLGVLNSLINLIVLEGSGVVSAACYSLYSVFFPS